MWWLVVAPPGLANKKDRSEKQEIASQKTNRFLPKKDLFLHQHWCFINSKFIALNRESACKTGAVPAAVSPF
jgi:hypothetical protein